MFSVPACATLLLLVAFAPGQQSQDPSRSRPLAANPGSGAQPQDQQPQPNPQDKAGVNSQIQSDLQSTLKSDPALSGADVQVSVDDVNITLTGTVQSQGQMERVTALASPFARYRNVVNKVAVH